jgi:hypothetical protein
MSSFKKMFTTLKIGKGEGKFAILSSIIVGIMWWMKHNFINTDKAQKLFATVIATAKSYGSSVMNTPTDLLDALEKVKLGVVAGAAGSLKAGIETVKGLVPGIARASIETLIRRKQHIYDKAIKSGKSHKEATILARAAAREWIDKAKSAATTSTQASTTTKVVY